MIGQYEVRPQASTILLKPPLVYTTQNAIWKIMTILEYDRNKITPSDPDHGGFSPSP